MFKRAMFFHIVVELNKFNERATGLLELAKEKRLFVIIRLGMNFDLIKEKNLSLSEFEKLKILFSVIVYISTF